MRIGIIAETISTDDKRVALTPFDTKKLLHKFPSLHIVVEPSTQRIFNDLDYQNSGAEINSDLSNCDLIIGIKEIDINSIIPGKTYLFFAHVGKKQLYHQQYFKRLAHQKITLIDYEYFTDKNDNRIIAFGYEAGMVGTYYALGAIGRKFNQYILSPTNQFVDHHQLITQLKDFNIPPIKIIISGTGIAAGGVLKVLDKIGIRSIDKNQFANMTFNKPVYCQLSQMDYIQSIKGKLYLSEDFRKAPSEYRSIFNEYANHADLYIACHYWENTYPNYLSIDDLTNKNSKLKVIADISCDLNGPIVSTIRESSHQDPFYDYNPFTQSEEPPFSSSSNISVMAVGNLPTALALEASMRFSKVLVKKVLPSLIENKTSNLVQRATLLKNGKLTPHFSYLYPFLNDDYV